jgi:trans-aconitate methyltransferase
VSDPAASTSGEFSALTCSAPDERAARMAEIVLQHAPRGPIRVLDLGCGTGGLLFRLAAELHEASCIGLDVSVPNIAAAEALRASRPERDRIVLQVADYRVWTMLPVDIITMDSVLNLIPGDTGSLVAKLARDLNPGGVVVNSMPYRSAYNSVLTMIRRGLRAVRSAASDAAIMQIAHVLHPEMNDDMLRERMHYMYLPPHRVMDHRLEAAFASHGLQPIATYPVKSASLAQLRHSVTVLRKRL